MGNDIVVVDVAFVAIDDVVAHDVDVAIVVVGAIDVATASIGVVNASAAHGVL